MPRPPKYTLEEHQECFDRVVKHADPEAGISLMAAARDLGYGDRRFEHAKHVLKAKRDIAPHLAPPAREPEDDDEVDEPPGEGDEPAEDEGGGRDLVRRGRALLRHRRHGHGGSASLAAHSG